MPVSGMNAAFGWVGQPAQDDLPSAAEYNPNGMTWHKVLGGDLGLQDDQRPYEPEVGGSILPPGTYKSAYWSGGQLAMRPRLAISGSQTKANGIVPLLWAFAGSGVKLASTVVVNSPATLPVSALGAAATVATITGLSGAHEAMFFPGANGTVQFGSERGDGEDRWLTMRRLIPTKTGFIGETFYNTKVASLRLSSAATGPIGMETTFLGGAGDSDLYDQYALESFSGAPPGADGWDFTTAANVDTIPMAGGGYVKQGALNSPEVKNVRDLRIDLQGNITSPEDTTMIGQFAPGGYSILGRRITISYTFLWDNADLYRKIKLGGVSGVKWSQTPFYSPFWVKFPDLAGTRAMGFFAQNVHWMSAPIGVQGESQVQMRVTGLVTDAVGAQWGLWLAATSMTGASVWPTGS
ncbi:MAG: hypothetical protein WA040_21170 [Anaerolineae bacterium]